MKALFLFTSVRNSLAVVDLLHFREIRVDSSTAQRLPGEELNRLTLEIHA